MEADSCGHILFHPEPSATSQSKKKKKDKVSLVARTFIPALLRQKQEGTEFKVSLGHAAGTCLKTEQQNATTTNRKGLGNCIITVLNV